MKENDTPVWDDTEPTWEDTTDDVITSSPELLGSEAPVQKTQEEIIKEKVLSVPKNIQENPLADYLSFKDSQEMDRGEAASVAAARGASLGLSKLYTPAIGATITGRPSEEIDYEKQTKEKLLKDTTTALEKIKNKAQTEMSKENPNQYVLAQYVDATEKLKQQQEEVSTMPEESWTKRYYDLKEEMKKRESEAEQKYPATSALSELAGGVSTLGTGFPLKPNSLFGKIGVGGGLGGVMGGTIGFSEGESKLLEGDVEQTAKETASGAKMGALLGGALPIGVELGKTAIKYGPALVKKIPFVEEFQAGQKFSKEVGYQPLTQEVLTDAGRRESEIVYNKIKKVYNKYGEKIGAWEEFATQADMSIDPTEIMQKLKADITTKGVAIPEEQKNQLLKLIDKNLGILEKTKLEDRANQLAMKKQEEGKLVSEPFIETKDGIPVAKFSETTEKQSTVKNIIGERDDRPEDIVNKGEKFIAELKSEGKEVVDSSYGVVDGRPSMKISYIEPAKEKITTLVGKEETPLINKNTPIAYAKELNKQLQEFTKLGNHELTVAANTAIKNIKDNIGNSIRMTAELISDPDELEMMLRDYQKVKNDYSNVKAAMEKAGLGSDKIGDFKDIAEIDTLHRLLIGQGRESELVRSEMVNLLKRSPEMRTIADDIYKQMDKVSKWEELFGGTEKGGKAQGIKDIWLQIRRKAATEGALWEVEKKSLKEKFEKDINVPFNNSSMSKLVRGGTEAIKSFAEKIASNPNNKAFSEQLKRVVDAPENRRAALLYALYQQPGFRQAMYNVEQEAEDESDSTRPY